MPDCGDHANNGAKIAHFQMMDADERDIYYYVKSWGNQYIALREIARRAGGKRRFQSDPDWANQILARMVERGILEPDGQARYRLKPIPKRDTQGKVWASPAILNILKESGKEYANVIEIEEEDEYYDNL